jgi:NADPH-dependent 2,4-dienoyl-CoA reductase/sulfur reductase-like enzyme
MSPARKIVVVGGGPAGVAAALAAKEQDSAAEVILLSDERHEPYEKPPLSKAVLTGKAMAHDAPIAGPKGVAAHGVRLELGTAVKAIDRDAHTVVIDAGERIGYDALVLATGSMNRTLPMFAPGRNGIYYLRTEAEAHALKARLHQSRSLLVIGGGLIGLEVAASAAELGVKASVIEIAPRVLARACNEELSALIHERHCARGVDLRVGIRPRPYARWQTDGSRSIPRAARSRPISSSSAPGSRPTIGWHWRPVSPCRTASLSIVRAAPAIRRSSRLATARAFPDRAG